MSGIHGQQCLACKAQNPAGARFCQNCGEKLVAICPACGTRNQPSANFCQNCGNRLADDARKSVDQQEAEPSPGLDTGLQKKEPSIEQGNIWKPLTSDKPIKKLAGERRVVTVLFADVVGSTSLAEKMDPEDWTSIMNGAFEIFTQIVYRYEGEVTRLLGDALLAIFGAPVAHEDDPLRAVHASLEMLREAEVYASEIKQKFNTEFYQVEFAIRIGINTGLVIAGGLGGDLVQQYTAMGDTVNLAARLQSLAEPMSLLITGDTYRQVSSMFETEDLGEVMVRGKMEAVHIFRVIAPKAVPGRQRGLAGLESELVGRDDELGSLIQLSRIVKTGVGRSVLVIGEAGLGKSRLLLEWKKAILPDDAITEGGIGFLWIEGRCLSYGQGLPYHLIIDLLRSLVGLSGRDNPAGESAVLASFIQELFQDSSVEILPYLVYILSLPLPESISDNPSLENLGMLDAQQIQNQVFLTIRRVLLAVSKRQPLILVVEDLHWADASSVDFLVRLLPVMQDAPIIFSFLTRPETQSEGWKVVTMLRDKLGPDLHEINLKPLSKQEATWLLANLLEIDAITEDMRSLILDRTEGNPFYVEEVIRMLLDQEVIIKRDGRWVVSGEIVLDAIPENLHALLQTRVDRLPEDARRILKIASVIGKQFPIPVLNKVLESQESFL